MTDMDEAFRKEFEVDPNAPKAMDMLDVLEEASTRAQRSRKAALEMQAAIAIRAILEGADVREVATKCGFDLSTGGGGQDEQHVMASIQGTMYEAIFGSPQQVDELGRFVNWLTNCMATIIRQKLGVEES